MLRLRFFIFSFFLFLGNVNSQDSIATEQIHKTISNLHANKDIFPVVIMNDTVFNVYEKVQSKSKVDQVKLCKRRIENVLSHDFYYKDSLSVRDSADYLLITYSDKTILEVGDITAQKLNRSKGEIADKYIEKAGEYLDRVQPEVLKSKFIDVAKFLGVYVIVLLMVIFIHRFIEKWIINHDAIIYKVTKKLRIYRLEEEDKAIALDNLLKVIKWFFWIVKGLITYIMLPFILGVFYFTKARGKIMISYLVDPFLSFINAFIDFIPSLFKIIVVVFIFRAFIKLINYFFNELEKGNVSISGFYKEWAAPTSKLVKLFLYAFLLTILFPLLPGSGSDVFKGVSMFLGLILSLGSTSVISNALSGLIMTYMRPFKLGDRIEADGVIGIVVQRNLLMTRVRTPKNVIITIPNAKILTGHSKNFTTAAERSNLIIHSTITIGYDVDWRLVHKLLISAARKTNGLIEQSGKEAFVLQNGLDDNYVEYEINAYTAQADRYVFIKSELHSNILDEFNNAGIEILSPKYVASRSGEERTYQNVEQQQVNTNPKQAGSIDVNEKINMKMNKIEKDKEEEKAKEKEEENNKKDSDKK